MSRMVLLRDSEIEMICALMDFAIQASLSSAGVGIFSNEEEQSQKQFAETLESLRDKINSAPVA